MIGHDLRRVVPAALLAVTVLVAGACGDDGGTGTATSEVSTTASTVAFVCPAPVVVTDADQLVALLAAQEWGSAGPASSGSPSPATDVVVGGTISLGSADVPLPADCLARDDCRHQAVFSAVDRQGATVEGDTDLFEGDTRLTLTDTAVRLRLSMLDTHPGPYNYVPLVSVIGPCGEPCGPGELSCPANGECYGSFDAFCRRCEGRPVRECVCRTPDGPADDGESCQYYISGDMVEVGHCLAGVCEVDG